MRTPRFDSTRRRDRLHLWALRNGRKLLRKLGWQPRPGDIVWVRLEELAYGLVVREDVMSFWVGHDSLALTAHDSDGHPRHLLLRMYAQDPQEHGYPRSERPAQLLVGVPEVN